MDSILQFDWNILTWLESNWNIGNNPILDGFFKIITTLGDGGAIWLITGGVLLFFKKLRPWGAAVILGVAFSGLLNEFILKPIVDRPRPFDFDWPLWASKEFFFPDIISRPHSLAFPSGHTGASIAAATAMWFINDKKIRLAIAIPGTILALLISFSRIYLHVHFPTDIIGGIVAGIAYGLLAVLAVKGLMKLIRKRNPNTNLF